MFFKLLFLFVTIPIVDLALLIWLSSIISWQATVLLVIVSGILGAWLATQQSRKVRSQLQTEIESRLIPSGNLLSDGAMIFFAAGLLLTPGLLTDVFGLTLLIPPIRNQYKKLLKRWFSDRFQFQATVFNQRTFYRGEQHPDDVLEGEVVDRSGETTAQPSHTSESSTRSLGDESRSR